ncbi:MAG: hypothetical protein ACKVS6_14275 [Planctomycetota bacterium]
MNSNTLLTSSLAFFATAALASAQVAPGAGDLAISEIMNNPGPAACVDDNNGEWFEITNISSVILNLDGVFVQDATVSLTLGTVVPTGVFFRINAASAAAINPTKITNFYPGQRLLFARHSTVDNGLNGVATVDYAYAVTSPNPVPADNSQVASSGAGAMNFNNGNDGCFITVGGPAVVPAVNPNNYVAGTVIESISYNSAAAPFVAGGSGNSGERMDLFSPMDIVFTGAGPFVATNSANLAFSCNMGTQPDDGIGDPSLCLATAFYNASPGLRNCTDTTNWPTNTNYDRTNFPNTGTMKAVIPVSNGVGFAEFVTGNGPANEFYYLGFADDANGTAEFPGTLLPPFFNSPGCINIDLFVAGYTGPDYQFSGTGTGFASISFLPDPLLIGKKFELQWLTFDSVNLIFVFSNGVRVEIVP